jgi:XTP/dITP diphosphohydrolase
MILKVVTSNPGKVIEYRESLASFGIGIEHVKTSYDEIQTSKLEDVVKHGIQRLKECGLEDFIIDDSGMFVNALEGFPGVYSAYVQKTIGNAGILKLMENVVVRDANFQCCIGCSINGNDIVVTGRCDGVILKKESGTEGFGYDPVFSHDGERSFAELPLHEKNEVSHRGLAVKLLVGEIKKIV